MLLLNLRNSLLIVLWLLMVFGTESVPQPADLIVNHGDSAGSAPRARVKGGFSHAPLFGWHEDFGTTTLPGLQGLFQPLMELVEFIRVRFADG